MEPITLKPRYEHDCDACVYLGQFEQYDLYYCYGEPTIVCRYSSDGPDYGSGLVFAVTSAKLCYTEALVRALKVPEWRPQIVKEFDREGSFPERVERFYELVKIADTPRNEYPLLINSLKTTKGQAYLEHLLKLEVSNG